MIRRALSALGRAARLIWTVFNAMVVLIYLVIARSFLFLTMALLGLYFASGSSAVRQGVELAVTEAIPGSLTVGGIQWGPLPGSIRLVDLHLADPAGQVVIEVQALDMDLDLLATGAGLVRWMSNERAPLSIGVRRVRVRSPTVRMITGEDGKMGLAQALSDGKKRPKGPRGAGVEVRVNLLSVLGAELAIHGPGTDMDIRDLSLVADLSVESDGDIRIRMPNGQIGALDAKLPKGVADDEAGDPLALRASNIRLARVLWRDNRLDLMVETDDLASGRLLARVELDLGSSHPGWAAEIELDLPGESPLLEALSGGVASGTVQLRVQGGGSFEEVYTEIQIASPDLQVAGLSLGPFLVAVAVEPHITGDGLLTHRVSVPRLVSQTLGGTIRLEDARFEPISTRPQAQGPPTATDTQFSARLLLDGVNPYALAAAPKVGSALAALPGLDGALNLDLQVSGGRRRGDGAWFGALHLPKLELGWGGIPGVPLADEVTLSGGLTFEERLLPDGGSGLDLHVAAFDLHSGADRIEIRGSAQLPHGALDLEFDVTSGRLGTTLAALGVEQVAGRLRLEDFHLTGTVDNPNLAGSIRLRDGRVGKLNLGRLDARVRLEDGVLDLERVTLAAPWGRATVTGGITLWEDGWRFPSKTKPFVIRKLRAEKIAVHKLLRGAGITTEVSLSLDKIRGLLSDPIKSLRGRGRLRTSAVIAGGERLREVRATLRGDRREIALDDVIVTLDGGQTIEGSVAFHKRARTVKAHIQTDSLPFEAIGAIARGVVPLKGHVTTQLHVEGTLERPVVIGTVGLENFAYGGVVLGDGVLNLTTGEDGVIDISASENFQDLEILEGSIMKLKRGSPELVLFRIRAKDADVFRVLPGIKVPDVDLRLTGIVDVEIRPGDPNQVYQLRVDAAAGGLALGLYDGEVRMENLSPLFLVHDTEGLTIEQTTLGRGIRQSLSFCGHLGSDGAMDFQVGGELELDLIHALRGAFSNMNGRLVIADDPDTGHALGGNRCLTVQGDRLLWVHGGPGDLHLSGRLRTKGVVLTPRGFGREIQLADGSTIELRDGAAPGELKIVLPESLPYRFRGQLESGGLQLTGQVILQNMKPDLMDLVLVGTDLFFSSPGQFNLTFNPEIRLRAEHFSDPEARKVKVSGPVLITEGLYYKNFDRIARALGSMGGGGAPSLSYSQPITERLPWIKDIELDVQVETPDFRVRSAFPMGQADLDTRFNLRVGGTLGNLQLYNRVEILPGGQLLYKVIRRDFEIVGGTIDFSGDPGRPRLDIEAQTEVTYLPAAATEEQAQDERQVTVSIRVSGVPPGVQIEFWSKDSPNFTDADLQSLILTGRPRDESGSIQDRVGLSVDFGRLVNDIIKSPIVEALNITVGAESVTTRMIYRLGRAVRLKTRVVQEATETRVSAGFTFQLSDALSLEGTLQRTDRSTNPTQTYEARFKYRIPIE